MEASRFRSDASIPAAKRRKFGCNLHEDTTENHAVAKNTKMECALVNPNVNRKSKRARRRLVRKNAKGKDHLKQLRIDDLFSPKDHRVAEKDANEEELASDDPMKQLQSLLSTKDRCSHYELLNKLGSGGFGEVWRAKNKSDDQVAIKKMSMRTNPKLLIAEILHLKQNIHDNIPKYMDSFMVDTDIWLVMQYIQGLDVARLVQCSVLSSSEIACVCHGVVSALTYLHSKRIVHRDIKGQNILISQHGGVYVADLGLSIVEGPDMGMGAGTTAFMAPEVISTTTYSCNVDIWSLGMTIIQMLTRKIPYYGCNKQMMRKRIMNKVYPTIEEYMPFKMADFLNHCLEWDGSRRVSSSILMYHEFLSSKTSEHALAFTVKAAHYFVEE